MAEGGVRNKNEETSQENDDELEMLEKEIKKTTENLGKEEERLKKEEERLKKEKERLEMMKQEIKRKKKQQKRKQKEDDDPSSGLSNLDTLFKEEEDTVETDKQGPVKKEFIPQKDHYCVEIPYEKRKGTASTHGIMYEVKMAALIFVKLFNLGYSFYLCSNLNGAGDFDDIVVKYTREDNTTETLFIQLKHAESDNKKRSLSLVQEGFFDLHKYFTSVCDSNLFTDSKHVIFGSNPSNVKYIIFTNADVDKSILCETNKVSSILCDISMKGDIFKICDYKDYEEFCNLIEKSINHEGEQHGGQLEKEISEYIETKKHKNLESILKLYNSETMEKYVNTYKNISVSKFEDFISNTRILCNQKNVNDLDDLIKGEIAKVTISNNETEQVFKKLIDDMKIWSEKNSYYLTEKSKMWNSIMREAYRSREREGELLNYGVRFKPEVVVEMQNTILQKYGVMNIVCHDDITTVTALKVWQALNLNDQQNYIMVSIKEYLENEESILRTWPNWWCKTLVIDFKDDCKLLEQVIDKLKHKFESEPEARLIIISPKKYRPQHSVINDNSTLDQLDDESQKKLITKIINFQGQNVSFEAILKSKHLKQLSGNALTHLIIDDIFILGENFDSYKNPHYIQRHIEIPYVSETILGSNEKDTIIAFELKKEQSALKELFNLNISTQERLKTDNSEKFENYNVHHKVKCDYVILTKGNEAEEFNILCKRFLNVHWIKECNGTVENIEDKRQHTNNRNTSQVLLLWKKSKGNIEHVRKYLMSSNVYSIYEERFITSDLESPVIITGEPGIGKSSLLKQTAASLKKAFPTKWVVFIDLPQYCKYLNQIENVLEKDVIEIIKMSVNINNTSLPIFDNASEDLENVIIFLDAFDEMSPYYTRKVKQFITLLVTLSSFVYITSRPCTVIELGNHTSAIPYTVKNFNEDEAKEFLTTLLQQKNKEIPEKKLETSLTEMITKPWSVQETLITNPLHIRMLAEIYNEIDKTECMKRLNILQIYTEFMKKKCEEYHKKTGADISHSNTKNDLSLLFQIFLSFNKTMAVKQIFSNELLKKSTVEFNIPELEENALCSQIIKIGIAETVMNNTIKYTHRSYAEYFSALWLADNWSTNTTIVKDIMDNKDMELIRKFYNLKCAENSPMHTAIIINDEKALSTLIERRKNLTSTDIMGRSALHLAAEYNNVKAVEQLAKHIPGMYFSDNISYTPIDYAITNHNWESTNILLSNQFVYTSEKATLVKKFQKIKHDIIYLCCSTGLQHLLTIFIDNTNFNHEIKKPEDIFFKKHEIRHSFQYNLKYHKHLFPLIIAVLYNQHEVVKLLIENKCNPWVTDDDDDGNTVLHIASSNGYTELVKYFIELSSDNTREDKDREQYATKYPPDIGFDSDDKKEALLSTICVNDTIKSMSINIKDVENLYNETPVMLAAKNGYTETLKYLVDIGSNVNHKTPSGNNVLLYAVRGGNLEIVKFLIEKGCNIEHKNNVGCTAVLCAVQYEHFDVMNLLVKEGADVNHANNVGYNALLYAAQYGMCDVVKSLVENRADINYANNDGYTALLYAAKKNYFDIVKSLVENGADINYANKLGYTALLYAAKDGYFDVVKLLVENGAHINRATNVDYTTLLYEEKDGHFDIVELLVEDGVRINNTHDYMALLYAAKDGHFDIVELLVEDGVRINNTDDYTTLLRAFKYGHIDKVKLRVGNAADIIVKNTALLYASKRGHFNVVKLLVENGAHIDYANKVCYTALLYAVEYGHIAVVKLLVENGANINHANELGYTALLYAAKKGYFDVVKLLVENGCEVEAANKDGYTALLYASDNRHFDVVKLLVEKGCNVNHKNNSGKTSLLYASKYENLDIIKLLLEKGCKINHEDNNGDTALLFAAYFQPLDVVELLVENGAYINHANKNGYTALLYVARDGHFDVVKLLVENGADINHANKDGNTALLYAARNGHFDVVKLLVENGAGINHANKNGYTALLYAARDGHFDVVKLLVENGADINHANKDDGYTALLYASDNRHFDVVKLLVEKGCNVNHSNNFGDTALLFAAKVGELEVVKFLAENGCTINHANNNGYTALQYASMKRHNDVVKLLKENGC